MKFCSKSERKLESAKTAKSSKSECCIPSRVKNLIDHKL